MKYEEVDYWDEVCEIMEWSKKHVTSTLHLCWGRRLHFIIITESKKYDLKQKMFRGIPAPCNESQDSDGTRI